MIIDIFFYVSGFIIDMVAKFAPTWRLWPDAVITGITYMAQTLASLNFLLPIDTVFSCVIFIMSFLVVYLPLLLIFKILNYLRGSSGL
jgi:hypothetical protein